MRRLPSLRSRRACYIDWGNRLVVEERPVGHTAHTDDRLPAAFDARACGSAATRQLARFEQHGC